MFNQKTVLGLIPARGGSKELPRKNVLPLMGKPLIAWTIEEAKKSQYIDKIIVSTDDEEIAEISRKYGSEVPFLRPNEFATDQARMIDVLNHVYCFYEKRGIFYDLILLLQPTSPLRSVEDIDQATELLSKKKARAIVSVCRVDHHPYLMNTLPENGSMKNFMKEEALNRNRQEFPDFYRLNGAIFLAEMEYVRKCGGFLGKESFAYVMPAARSIDIDTEIDFKLADILMHTRVAASG